MKRRKIDGWPVKLAVLSISTILVSAPSVNGALPQMRDSLHVTQAQVEALSGGANLQVPFPVFAVLDLMLLSASALINRRTRVSAAKEPENAHDDN